MPRGYGAAVSPDGNVVVRCAGRAQGIGKQRPNVLLIICDDMNLYVLHRNGSPPAKTPNIDRLAEHGVTFTNMHAVMPMCGPSRACLWTGIYPQQHGNFNVWQWDSVPLLNTTART